MATTWGPLLGWFPEPSLRNLRSVQTLATTPPCYLQIWPAAGRKFLGVFPAVFSIKCCFWDVLWCKKTEEAGSKPRKWCLRAAFDASYYRRNDLFAFRSGHTKQQDIYERHLMLPTIDEMIYLHPKHLIPDKRQFTSGIWRFRWNNLFPSRGVQNPVKWIFRAAFDASFRANSQVACVDLDI